MQPLGSCIETAELDHRRQRRKLIGI